MKTPSQDALTPIYLASCPEAEGVTGQYFADRKPKTSSKASYDTAAANANSGDSKVAADLPLPGGAEGI